jgi:hypothetical protein
MPASVLADHAVLPCPCELRELVRRFYDVNGSTGSLLYRKAGQLDDMPLTTEALRKHMEFEEMFIIPLASGEAARRVVSDHNRIREQMTRNVFPTIVTWLRHGLWEREHLIPLIIFENSSLGQGE